MESRTKIGIVAGILLGLLIIVFFMLEQKRLEQNRIEDYLVSVSFDSTNTGLTPYTERAFRVYDCREVSDDYWTYPRDYDKVFNSVYEICNKTYPELFNITIEDSLNTSIYFKPPNLSLDSLTFSVNTSTPYIVVDCDFFEELNWTNKNISLTRNNKSIQIDIIKLCEGIQ